MGNPLATEKIGKLMARFCIPAVIGMVVSALYNFVDQIFIGHGVGIFGNAATNVEFPINTVAMAMSLLVGMRMPRVLCPWWMEPQILTDGARCRLAV